MAALSVCAAVWGCMRRALELTTEYLKTRRQFGKHLADFQVLQHRVADMYIATNDAKSILLRAVAAMDGGPLERQRGVSAAKLKVMSTAQWVTGEAIQLHGGIGFTEEYEVGRLLQKAVVGERLFGDLDYHIERYIQLSGGQCVDNIDTVSALAKAG